MQMLKTLVKSYFLFIVMCSVVFLGLSNNSNAEQIQIRAATWHPTIHRLTEAAFKRYGSEIERRTNNKVKFNWFVGGSLVKPHNSFEVLKSGLIDWVVLGTHSEINKLPITEGLSLPFIVDSSQHAAAVAWEMYKTIPEMREEYSDIKLLGMFSTAIMNLAFTNGPPPNSLEELKNLRVAAGSSKSVDMLRLLGASPQPIKPGEIYMALQRGVTDGVLTPDAPLKSYKYSEVVSNHVRGDFLVIPLGYAMNINKWNKLPPDVQKVFEDVSVSGGCLAARILDDESDEVIQSLKKRGDKFYELTEKDRLEWIKRVEPMYNQWISKLNSKGMNGKAIFDRMMEISTNLRKSPCKPADEWWGLSSKK